MTTKIIGELGENIYIVEPIENEIKFGPTESWKIYHGSFYVEAEARTEEGELIANINVLPWVRGYRWIVAHADRPSIYRELGKT